MYTVARISGLNLTCYAHSVCPYSSQSHHRLWSSLTNLAEMIPTSCASSYLNSPALEGNGTSMHLCYFLALDCQAFRSQTSSFMLSCLNRYSRRSSTRTYCGVFPEDSRRTNGIVLELPKSSRDLIVISQRKSRSSKEDTQTRKVLRFLPRFQMCANSEYFS